METTSAGRATPQWATLAIGGGSVRVDLAHPHDLSVGFNFDGADPRWFDAPRSHSDALESGSFIGRVRNGGSCNCDTISLTPHCDGTHTESAGHLTRDRFDVREVMPAQLLPALLVTVTPAAARRDGESSRPAPVDGDLLVTRAALEKAWPAALPFAPLALIVRTLPNPESKRQRDYRVEPAPFLSLPAAQWLVERGIEHLVLDVPSLDRTHDEGHLVGHRIFFGLPPGSTSRGDAARSRATITELAFVPDEVHDGPCILSLAVPAIGGDAVPSQPIVYPLTP